MYLYIENEIYNDGSYRIRFLNGLIDQIKADHDELIRLWAEIKNRNATGEDTQQIFEKMAWIKKGLSCVKDCNQGTIEGVYWTGLENIERDLKVMEYQIIRMIWPVL